MLRALRRTGFSEERVRRFRYLLERFLADADLAESGLIIDGPGLGVASHFVMLSLLGAARVRRFQAIHTVSASAYGVLFRLAHQRGMLTLTPTKIGQFNRANQARHGIGGWSSASRFLLRKLAGAPYLFPNDRSEEVLAYAVHTDFLRLRVSALPANVSFWTYCLEARQLCEIQRNSRFAEWSLGEVVRAVTAVKGFYAPFQKDGKTYVDAMTTPQLRERYRLLRRQYRHVLFLHMSREGIRGNTTFVKMHAGASGRVRVMLDFLYFLSGLDNPDLDEAIRVGLDLTPIES